MFLQTVPGERTTTLIAASASYNGAGMSVPKAHVWTLANPSEVPTRALLSPRWALVEKVALSHDK